MLLSYWLVLLSYWQPYRYKCCSPILAGVALLLAALGTNVALLLAGVAHQLAALGTNVALQMLLFYWLLSCAANLR
jgi:hypothetical protein